MKKSAFLAVLIYLLISRVMAQPQPDFQQYFVDKTMRIDFYHIGDAKNEIITLDQIYQQGNWAGSTKNLIDPFNNGRYYIKIYDADSNELLYSKGYNSYFGEYQTSDPALRGIQRTYHESALIPYPKQKIKFVVEHRDRQNNLSPFFETEIDPGDVSIIKEKISSDVSVFTELKNGSPHEKVDLVFLAEGYIEQEKLKFEKDLHKFSNVFLEQEPYKSHKNSFNIYGVFKPSEESGCDEPRHDSFKNTVLNSTFNSLGSARYLLTEDNKSLRDIAAHVPYDAVVIMVNHNRYGGGGIYNFFCTFTAHNQWSEYLFLHEFGHSFGGLADEYYSSSTAYNDFYPPGVEPTEPNITALLDPVNLKWQQLITPGIEIPTPWNKKAFDRIDSTYQIKRQELNKKIARLKREHAPESQIKAAQEEASAHSRKFAGILGNFLKKSKYAGKVGAFEGAGYSSKGLYRPMLDCIMFSKGKKPYCKVCEQAIIKIIEQYSK